MEGSRSSLYFSYILLDQDTQTFIHIRTVEIKALVKRTTKNIQEIGGKLLEVKSRLGHGEFSEWIKSEFEWSHDTASNFMRVAQRFGDNPKISEFAPSALYLLAAPSTPEDARIEALELADKGETISHAKAKAIVERHKADDEDLSKLEALAKEETTPVKETSVQNDLAMRIDDPVELPLPVPASNNKSDLVPFHCLMNHKQREQLHEAINQAKTDYELRTTAEALDTIAQEYLNA